MLDQMSDIEFAEKLDRSTWASCFKEIQEADRDVLRTRALLAKRTNTTWRLGLTGGESMRCNKLSYTE
jgi:hypothetical protein